jgi:hypothetical protein
MYTLKKEITETLSDEELDMRKATNRVLRKQAQDDADKQIAILDEEYATLSNLTPDATN